MRRTFIALVGFVLASACSLTAASAEWTIARSSGIVWVGAEGAQTASLMPPRGSLPEGATITTASSGRVLLTRNKEVMTIGPNTVVTIPADDKVGFTTIIQRSGQIEFEVEKRNVRHFAVRTPYLAAVVKGTRFTVQINRKGASVSVERGLVGVTNAGTGQTDDVAPGQTASVSARPGPTVLTGQPTDVQKKDKGKGKSASNAPGTNPGTGVFAQASNSQGPSGNGNNGNGGGNGNNGNGNGGTSGNGGGSGGSSNGGGGSSGNGGGSSGNGGGGGNGGDGNGGFLTETITTVTETAGDVVGGVGGALGGLLGGL